MFKVSFSSKLEERKQGHVVFSYYFMFDQFDDIIMHVKELLFLKSVGGGYLPVFFVANFFFVNTRGRKTLTSFLNLNKFLNLDAQFLLLCSITDITDTNSCTSFGIFVLVFCFGFRICFRI